VGFDHPPAVSSLKFGTVVTAYITLACKSVSRALPSFVNASPG
jgi:hypothetical protein